jgi:capsular polysaccharide biosynthesis protein
MNERVDTRTVVRAVLRWWTIVLGAMIVAAVGAYAVSQAIPPVYEGTTSVMVGGAIQASDVTLDDIETSQQLTLTYADLVGREPVLQGVVETLDLQTTWPELRTRVQANLVPGNTQLIEITARAGSPEQAKAIAGAVADQLVALSPTGIEDAGAARIEELNRNIDTKRRRIRQLRADLAAASPGSPEVTTLRHQIAAAERLIGDWQDTLASIPAPTVGKAVNQLEVIEGAQASTEPVIPNTKLNVLIAACLGLLLGGAIAFALYARREASVPQLKALPPEGGSAPNGRDPQTRSSAGETFAAPATAPSPPATATPRPPGATEPVPSDAAAPEPPTSGPPTSEPPTSEPGASEPFASEPVGRATSPGDRW